MATMDTKKGIPGINLAALNAIPDDNVRSVLQSIVDGWHVRNGSSGNGDNAFVTRQELVRGFQTGTLPGTGGGSSQSVQSLGGSGGATDVGKIIAKMQAAIIESPLFKSLGNRITLVDAATVANGNAIATEITNRANADNAIYTTYNSQLSVINSNIASLSTTQTTQASTIASLSSSVTTLTAQTATNTTAISTEASARSTADGVIESKYSVKIDSNGYVTGFGLISSANNSTPYSAFIVRADQFAIGSPSGPGITPQVPFIVNTTTDSAGNPAGVYIDTAMIKKLTADKIDTRGLTIKDASGNIIFGAGNNLDWARIANQPGSIYNGNISIGSDGTLYGAGGGSVSLGGLGAGAMAYINQINSSNVWTYIGAAAIGTAFITDAAITNAKIGNAEVGTLKISGNAVSFGNGISGSGAQGFYTATGGLLVAIGYSGGSLWGNELQIYSDAGSDYFPKGSPVWKNTGGDGGYMYVEAYGPTSGISIWGMGAGSHHVGIDQPGPAYNNPKLIWMFFQR